LARRGGGRVADWQGLLAPFRVLAQDRDRDRGLAAGADDYFTKPFSPLALLNMVERVRQTQSQAG
jgi:DNA-binding response OmpR family regulator